jgi:cytosine/adenosine deaminase-related metal-dependent hydrolase
MTYRKFKADQLFTGREMREGDDVLITTEEGIVEAILPAAEAGEDTERLSGMLCPGFVNCHCHLELSHMKGAIPEGTGLVDFLLAVMRQRGEGEDDMVNMAMAEAEEAMFREGIIAVGDICNTTDSLAQKAGRRLYYHNFIETMGFIEGGARDRFEAACRVFAAFAEAYKLPIESNSLSPHAPYSVSPALFGLVAGFPGNHLLTIHNQESEAENEFFLTGKGDFLRLYAALGIDTSFFRGVGKRSLESCLSYFYRNQSLILVHNLATGEDDLRQVMGRRVVAGTMVAIRPSGPDLFFCLCPNANLYISRQLPDADLLIKYNCEIVLGTDSLASNHRLSILEEIKTLERQYPHLGVPMLMEWATYNGARALQMDKVLGSFEAGKQPGVVVIENMEGQRLGPAAASRRLL